MLHWRRKSELKRHKLWLKLVACSFGMHLILLMMLFIGYRDTIKLTFSMNGKSLQTKSAPVTLFTLPAPKKVVTRPTRHITPRKRVAQKKIIKPVTKIAAKKPTPIKKTLPKKAVAALKPKSSPQKIAKNVTHKKPVPFDKIKKNKQEIKTVNSSVAHKHVEKKQQDQSIAFDTNQAIDNGMIEDFIVLQQELAKHWQPPVGIDRSCACAITAHIDRQGKIEDIIIDDSSGVLMFDVAARTAMLAMNLPHWTWGKSLSITFKP